LCAARVCDRAEITTTNCAVDHTIFFKGAPLQKRLKGAFKKIGNYQIFKRLLSLNLETRAVAGKEFAKKRMGFSGQRGRPDPHAPRLSLRGRRWSEGGGPCDGKGSRQEAAGRINRTMRSMRRCDGWVIGRFCAS
jgi:hypothetical protein